MPSLFDLVCLAADNPDGKDWYAKATAEIESICKLEHWDISYFTGILAVTSPRCSVRRNIRIALQYVSSKRILKNVMRSIRRSIEIWDTAGEIRGQKTSSFYAALMGDSHAVVLDTHMANVLHVNPKAFNRKPELARLKAIVCDVAAQLRVPPASAQAMLWYGQKRIIGDNPELFPILDEYRNWLSYDREFPNTGKIDDFIAQPLFDTATDDASFDVSTF